MRTRGTPTAKVPGMRVHLGLALGVLLAFVPSLATAGPGSSFLSDEQYAELSAIPIDSLGGRQYDLLVRERELRAMHAAIAAQRQGWSIARHPMPTGIFLAESAYDSLSAVPIDSLGARTYDLLMRERQFRAWMEPGKGNARLISDRLYVRLTSVPIESLSAREFDLLMRERQARAPRMPDPTETHLAGFVALVAVVGGFIAGLAVVASAMAHGWP
jgi:hypothetical protein